MEEQKDAWRLERVDANGQAAPDPGGPCSSCPPQDPNLLGLAKIQELLAALPEKSALIQSMLTETCGVCKGTGHVRVCSKCDGYGTLNKVRRVDFVGEAFEEEEEFNVPAALGPDGEMVPPRLEKRMVTKTRDVETESWVDGVPCTTCGGVGQESIPAPVSRGH